MGHEAVPFAAVVSWLQFWGAPLLTIAISAAYFFAADPSAGFGRRALWSAHGVAAAVIYFGAMAVWITGASRPLLGTVFLWLSLLPIALILYSLVGFRGKRLVHVLQVPNLVAIGWGTFIGAMAATGDWL